MSQLILNIKNESTKEKILWMLEHFKDDGIDIEQLPTTKHQPKNTKYTDEYIEKNWREIGMGTHSANLDDDERIYDACGKFYNDKHSS